MAKKGKYYDTILDDNSYLESIQGVYFAEEQEDDRPSKSEKKRQMTALQGMGEQLVNLQPAKLKKFNLPDELLTAILEAQKIKAMGAKRRQLQFIGKVMRKVDDETIASIQHSLVLLSKGMI